MTLIDGLHEVEAESIVRATMVTFLSEKLLTGSPKEILLCFVVIEATAQNYSQFFKSIAEDGLLGAICLVLDLENCCRGRKLPYLASSFSICVQNACAVQVGNEGSREMIVVDEFAFSPRERALVLVQRWSETVELQAVSPQFNIAYNDLRQSV